MVLALKQRLFNKQASELIPLAALFLAAVCLFVFGKLTSEIMQGDLGDMDRRILLSLRAANDHSKALGPAWLQIAARDVTSLGSPAIVSLITLFAFAYLVLKRQAGSALLLIVAVGGGSIFSNSVKHLIARPRPDFVADVVQIQSYSFPSGHSMLSAVTFLTLGALLARVENESRLKVFVLAIAVTLTLLVGLSRVYLGVHWPTDVFAGWAAGAAWAMFCWGCAAWLQTRTLQNETRTESELSDTRPIFRN